VQGAENIRLDLDQYLSSVWSAPAAAGHVTVGKLWEYYCQRVAAFADMRPDRGPQ
jgi:hypothetical protein